jgi:hypothetical protein
MSVHYLSPRHRLRAVQFRPLAWPADWPRTTAPRRQHAVVHLSALGYAPNRALSPTEAMAQLFRALEAMCATTCIVFAYRSRARQFHPDVGGTGHDMVRLNDAIAEARRIAIA